MNLTSPFFSVVVPTFNRPHGLKQAVDSILNQTFKDFEIIIVNNGITSVDNNWGNQSIRILTEERKGANYARNKGIENARGEFICFLDDDDIYFENHLQVLHDLIIKNEKKEALYRTFTKQQNDDGTIVDQPVKLKAESQTNLDHLLTVLLVMHCVCCSKSILQKIKFDPAVPVAQDYNLWIRILAEFPIVEAPQITTLYYRTENSTSSPSLEKYFQYVSVYKNLFNVPNIKSQVSRKIVTSKLLRYYDLLLSCYIEELSLREFMSASLGMAKNRFGYILSVHYFKLFGKFVVSRFGR